MRVVTLSTLFLIGVLYPVVSVTGSDAATIRISAPESGQAVSVRHEITGKVPDPKAKVWVVVQPRETTDCWVQTPILVNKDGTWRVMAQFGEKDASHSGKKYEIRALANPKTQLEPGKTRCWPDAEAHSDAVYVVRE